MSACSCCCYCFRLLLQAATSGCCYSKQKQRRGQQDETKRGMPRRTRTRQFEISKQDVSDREAFEWRHQQWRLLALPEPTSS
uniref:Secreted protein n=1 Tax=Vespula pensylvanica TaxID=30213 RepID=A0A834PAN7_VESPE|nr:hypothetical protein H0235_002726 [Vespula pensylvanica]